MSATKAVEHFTGKNDTARLNCAQAVAAAFETVLALPEQQRRALASCGGGGAPGGLCGSLHAALEILAHHYPQQRTACHARFVGRSGAPDCRGIRSLRRLSCVDCVRTAATFLEETLGSCGTVEAQTRKT